MSIMFQGSTIIYVQGSDLQFIESKNRFFARRNNKQFKGQQYTKRFKALSKLSYIHVNRELKQRLLHLGPLLHFLSGAKIYYTWDLYYIQGHLIHLRPQHDVTSGTNRDLHGQFTCSFFRLKRGIVCKTCIITFISVITTTSQQFKLFFQVLFFTGLRNHIVQIVVLRQNAKEEHTQQIKRDGGQQGWLKYIDALIVGKMRDFLDTIIHKNYQVILFMSQK